MKGKVGYFKGKKLSEEHKINIGLGLKLHPATNPIKKGEHRGINTEFTKGHKRNLGENHGFWKGEEAKYGAKHAWIRSRKGNPVSCEDCGLIGNKVGHRWNIDWSNVDHKYRRVIGDYNGRCSSCHKKYDKQNKLKRMYESKAI